ncbi:hypothetical protein [Microbispora sp. KK1-11]|uniref:hypothetical protein n=1 Tax=Microbispora sp. KK1-11 TaxID=2053005 RepID=UPI001158AFEC|nr:hypothetical protein [Microbispora sp. KK1-11]TQS30831.1 hypothetical protein FLW16_00605 [Microbispora sp. KK1-11]
MPMSSCGRGRRLLRRPDRRPRPGLVPGFARRGDPRAPVAWIAVDSPGCRRTVTLYWGADSHLSSAARLMRTTITNWDWTTGDPQETPPDRFARWARLAGLTFPGAVRSK